MTEMIAENDGKDDRKNNRKKGYDKDRKRAEG
jgi:hypothetical protein